MIKDVEVAMVHAATYALDYQDKKFGADTEEIIKNFLRDPTVELKGGLQVYSVAAINEIMKLKRDRANRTLTNRQLVQQFTRTIPILKSQIAADNED